MLQCVAVAISRSFLEHKMQPSYNRISSTARIMSEESHGHRHFKEHCIIDELSCFQVIFFLP